MLVISILLLLTTAQASKDITAITYKYTNSYDLIWKDTGSRGHHDVSIWRLQIPGGYCSLGDIAVGHYRKPSIKGLLLKSKDGKALATPSRLSKVWKDTWSGADWDVAVYRMIAPSGYTCLGDIAVRSHSTLPSKADYCCVKNDYVVRGKLSWTYNDKGTGALHDFGLWTVKKTSGTKGVQGGNFRSKSSHSSSGLSGYLLAGDGIKVVDESIGIQKIIMTNVEYDVAHEIRHSRPIAVQRLNQINTSIRPQTTTHVIRYESSISSTYKFSHAVQIGVALEIKAGLPDIAMKTTTISASNTFTGETGKTTTDTEAHEARVAHTLGPGKRSTGTVTLTKTKVDIPYKADIEKIHFDGTTTKESICGVYEGVTTSNFDVLFSDEDIN